MGLCFDCNPYDGENAVKKPKVVNRTSSPLLVGYKESFPADLIPAGQTNDGEGPVVEITRETEGVVKTLGREYYIVL